MLADQLDFVVGVDSHRDRHAVAIVAVVTGVVVFEGDISADSDGYAEALRFAQVIAKIGVDRDLDSTILKDLKQLGSESFGDPHG